jgi:hypothetical protein
MIAGRALRGGRAALLRARGARHARRRMTPTRVALTPFRWLLRGVRALPGGRFVTNLMGWCLAGVVFVQLAPYYFHGDVPYIPGVGYYGAASCGPVEVEQGGTIGVAYDVGAAAGALANGGAPSPEQVTAMIRDTWEDGREIIATLRSALEGGAAPTETIDPVTQTGYGGGCAPCPGGGGDVTVLASTAAGEEGAAPGVTDEQYANAGIIVAVGRERSVPEFGMVVAVAAALQESGLRNLDYGDSDSLGLFQQRPSMGWGTVEQITDPTYASRAFYGGPDVPPANPGLLDIAGWQTMTVTAAAQAVQRSGHPDAYADDEPLARELVTQLLAGDPLTPVGEDCAAGDFTTIASTDVYPLPGCQPHVDAVAEYVGPMFDIGTIWCQAARTTVSDHPDGLALDFMTNDEGLAAEGAEKANGDALALYVQSNAATFNVKYVIWYQRIWYPGDPVDAWSPMEDRGNANANHLNHVHVSFEPLGSVV